MNRFGSEFRWIKYYFLIFLFLGIIFLIILENFDFIDFLIAILIFTVMGLFDVYLSYNGLVFQEKELIVCNMFIGQKFSISYNEIEKIELVASFRNAYMRVFMNNYEQKKILIRGYSVDDLKKCAKKFDELGIDAIVLDRS